jgi:hypothetical protein
MPTSPTGDYSELDELRGVVAQPTGSGVESSADEPYLGLPTVSGYVLSSTTAGVRTWISAGGGGGSGDVLTYADNSFTATGNKAPNWTLEQSAISGPVLLLNPAGYSPVKGRFQSTSIGGLDDEDVSMIVSLNRYPTGYTENADDATKLPTYFEIESSYDGGEVIDMQGTWDISGTSVTASSGSTLNRANKEVKAGMSVKWGGVIRCVAASPAPTATTFSITVSASSATAQSIQSGAITLSGTISVAGGGTAVTGNGSCKFTEQLLVGGSMNIYSDAGNRYSRKIASITDNTSLTLVNAMATVGADTGVTTAKAFGAAGRRASESYVSHGAVRPWFAFANELDPYQNQLIFNAPVQTDLTINHSTIGAAYSVIDARNPYLCSGQGIFELWNQYPYNFPGSESGKYSTTKLSLRGYSYNYELRGDPYGNGSKAFALFDTSLGFVYYIGSDNKMGIGSRNWSVSPPTTALEVVGTVTATLFSGSGASLTGVPASTVAMLNESTDTTCFPLFSTTSTAGNVSVKTVSSFQFNSANGKLDVSSINTGSITADSVVANQFIGNLEGNGALVTSINADNIASGTLANARLDSDLQTWAGVTPGTGIATALGLSANGSGAVVLATSPTITTPAITTTSTTTSPVIATMLAPSITTSATVTNGALIPVGVSASLLNAGSLQFHYEGAASTNNFFGLGIYADSGGPEIKIYQGRVDLANGINGTVGGTTPSTGSFTTLAASGTITANGGTIDSSTSMKVGPSSGTSKSITFQVRTSAPATITPWNISAAGNLLAGTTNTYDLGTSISVAAPRDGFFGRNLECAGELRTYDHVNINGQGRLYVAAPGYIYFGDNTLSGAIKLGLGGSSAGFPMIKRSTTTAAFRLGDDSADCPISASNITASGTLTVAGALIRTPEALAPALNAAAAISVSTPSSGLAINGANAVSLANGTNGQIKTIVITAVTAAGTATLSPTTTPSGGGGYTTVAFTSAGQTLTLQYFTTGGWQILAVRGATPA